MDVVIPSVTLSTLSLLFGAIGQKVDGTIKNNVNIYINKLKFDQLTFDKLKFNLF